MSKNKIDWSILGAIPRGLAVEGKDDKLVIEAFLEAGEKLGYWSNWRSKVQVESAENRANVLKELALNDSRIWGLIDRDWHSEQEIQTLQAQYPNLLILPRVMIENYCIDPVEIQQLLPANQQILSLQAAIEQARDAWVQNGALWQILHEQDANNFGSPKDLLSQPLSEQEIEQRLRYWYQQLEPDYVMNLYRQKQQQFLQNPQANYRLHIYGKSFFSQVVLQVLNRNLGQKKENVWFATLFSTETFCPHDIIPVLQKIVS